MARTTPHHRLTHNNESLLMAEPLLVMALPVAEVQKNVSHGGDKPGYTEVKCFSNVIEHSGAE